MKSLVKINEVTMTTVEIANQTGKRPDHVKRDAEVMLLELYGEKDLPKFGASYVTKGKTNPCYRLPKREVMILISGYSIKLRAAIIDRLEELEKGIQKSSINPIDSLSEELRAYALFEVPTHIAQIESVKRVKAGYDVDFSYLLEVAPAQQNIQEHEVMLEPTELGKYFKLSATALNKRLMQKGLQINDGTGWTATKRGSKISSKHSWSSGTKSGYNYKWNFEEIKKIMKRKRKKRNAK